MPIGLGPERKDSGGSDAATGSQCGGFADPQEGIGPQAAVRDPTRG